MNRLPEDVFRHLLQFQTDEEQSKILHCSSTFSLVKKAVRKVKLKENKLMKCCNDKKSLVKLLSLMEDPGKQLMILNLGKIIPPNFPFRRVLQLNAHSIALISRLFSLNLSIFIENLSIENKFENSNRSGMDALVQMCELGLVQNLMFVSSSGIELESFLFPYFPNIKSLEIRGSSCIGISLPGLYVSHLQKLKLEQCSNIDVSCLDRIPDLTIIRCSSVKGISLLKNNQRIEIKDSNIHDFSDSFCNSREISLTLSGDSSVLLDLSKWQKVKTLTLHCWRDSRRIEYLHPTLPLTVRRCHLNGPFVREVDWKRFTSGLLIELSLSHSSSLFSLEGLGLDTIPMVTLEWLDNLTSLEGLGGRNRKVVVRNCSQVSDFTAVRMVDTVNLIPPS